MAVNRDRLKPAWLKDSSGDVFTEAELTIDPEDVSKFSEVKAFNVDSLIKDLYEYKDTQAKIKQEQQEIDISKNSSPSTVPPVDTIGGRQNFGVERDLSSPNISLSDAVPAKSSLAKDFAMGVIDEYVQGTANYLGSALFFLGNKMGAPKKTIKGVLDTEFLGGKYTFAERVRNLGIFMRVDSLQRLNELRKTHPVKSDFMYSAMGRGTTSILQSLALGYVFGPAGTLGYFGSKQGFDKYTQALEKGKSEGAATEIGAAMGLVEGSIEAVGNKLLFGFADEFLGQIYKNGRKVIKGSAVKAVTKLVGKSAASNAVEEVSQATGDVFLSHFFDLEKIEGKEGVAQAVWEICMQGVAGAILGAGSTTVTVPLQLIRFKRASNMVQKAYGATKQQADTIIERVMTEQMNVVTATLEEMTGMSPEIAEQVTKIIDMASMETAVTDAPVGVREGEFVKTSSIKKAVSKEEMYAAVEKLQEMVGEQKAKLDKKVSEKTPPRKDVETRVKDIGKEASSLQKKKAKLEAETAALEKILDSMDEVTPVQKGGRRLSDIIKEYGGLDYKYLSEEERAVLKESGVGRNSAVFRSKEGGRGSLSLDDLADSLVRANLLKVPGGMNPADALYEELKRDAKQKLGRETILKENKEYMKVSKQMSALLKEQEEMGDQLDKYHQELLDITIGVEEDMKAFKLVNKKDISSSQYYSTWLKSLSNYLSGVKQGASMQKEMIRSIQIAYRNIINKSDMTNMDKKKFLNRMVGMNDVNKFISKIPSLIEDIGEVYETYRKRGLIDRFKALEKKIDVNKLRPEYKKPIKDIFDAFRAAKLSDKKKANLEELLEYLTINQNDHIVSIRKLAELKGLSQVAISELNADQILDIINAIELFMHLNEVENDIIVEGKKRDKAKTIDDLLGAISRGKDITNLEDIDLTEEALAKSGDSVFDAIFGKGSANPLGIDALPMGTVAEWLDGAEEGMFNKIFFKSLELGRIKEMSHFQEGSDTLKFFAKDLGLDLSEGSLFLSGKKSYSDVDSKEFTKKTKDGKTVKFTLSLAERMHLALLYKNAHTRRRMVKGGFRTLAMVKTAKDPIVLNEADWTDIITFEDPKVDRVMREMSRFININQTQKLNEMSVRLWGYELYNEVDYWRGDVSSLDLGSEIKAEEFAAQAESFLSSSLQGMNMNKMRVENSKPVVAEDVFSAYYTTLREASMMIGLAEPVINAKKIVYDKSLEKKMIDSNRRKELEYIKKFIKDIELGNRGRIDKELGFFKKSLQNIHRYILSNPAIWLKQLPSYCLAMWGDNGIDAKYMATSFKLTPSTQEIADMSKHPLFRERLELGKLDIASGDLSTRQREARIMFLNDIDVMKPPTDGLDAVAKWILKIKSGFDELIPMRFFDTAAITSIWRAAKKEAMAKHPELKGDTLIEYVNNRTWDIVSKSQPMFDSLYRSAIGRAKGGVWGFVAVFASQRNQLFSMGASSIFRFLRSEQTIKDQTRLAKDLGIIMLLQGVLLAGIQELYDWIRGKDHKQSFPVRMAGHIIKNMLGPFYIVSEVSAAAISKMQATSGMGGFDVSNPYYSTASELAEMVADMGKFISDIISQDKHTATSRYAHQKRWKTALPKMTIKALQLAGKLSGQGILQSGTVATEAFVNLVDDDDKKKKKKKSKWSY